MNTDGSFYWKVVIKVFTGTSTLTAHISKVVDLAIGIKWSGGRHRPKAHTVAIALIAPWAMGLLTRIVRTSEAIICT